MAANSMASQRTRVQVKNNVATYRVIEVGERDIIGMEHTV